MTEVLYSGVHCWFPRVNHCSKYEYKSYCNTIKKENHTEAITYSLYISIVKIVYICLTFAMLMYQMVL